MVKPVKPARRSSKASKASAAPAVAASKDGLITATIDAATGKIVEVRSVDNTGAHSELTSDRRSTLSKQSGDATLEDLFEEAFEAGIACVFGDDTETADASESEADLALRRQILRPMIQHSAARRLMRQEVLGRAIVGTLIQKSAAKATSRPSSKTKTYSTQ